MQRGLTELFTRPRPGLDDAVGVRHDQVARLHGVRPHHVLGVLDAEQRTRSPPGRGGPGMEVGRGRVTGIHHVDLPAAVLDHDRRRRCRDRVPAEDLGVGARRDLGERGAVLPQGADVGPEPVGDDRRIGVVTGDVDDGDQRRRRRVAASMDLHRVTGEMTGGGLVAHADLPPRGRQG